MPPKIPDQGPTGFSIGGGAQRTFLVDKYKMQYEGLFDILDLYKLITEYFEEKGYDKRELVNAEMVNDNDEKFIELIIQPWKKLTDYAKSEIRVRIIMEDVKKVEIEKNGIKINAHHGKIFFTFDVYVDSDYEGRWGMTGNFALIRLLFERFFFSHLLKQANAESINDFKTLVYQIKVFLNLTVN